MTVLILNMSIYIGLEELKGELSTETNVSKFASSEWKGAILGIHTSAILSTSSLAAAT